LIFESTRKI
jgi:hypothetical protein